MPLARLRSAWHAVGSTAVVGLACLVLLAGCSGSSATPDARPGSAAAGGGSTAPTGHQGSTTTTSASALRTASSAFAANVDQQVGGTLTRAQTTCVQVGFAGLTPATLRALAEPATPAGRRAGVALDAMLRRCGIDPAALRRFVMPKNVGAP